VTSASALRRWPEAWLLEELLVRYPGLRFAPSRAGLVELTGCLAFAAQPKNLERIDDEYQLEIAVTEKFPKELPSVRETAGRIPDWFHRLSSGALCLGSPTRLRLIAAESRSLLRFIERAVVPYLYGHSYFEKYRTIPFGELDHQAGIIQDFASILGIEDNAVREFVWLATMRKRQANKHPCPCGSRRRLGCCHHRRINRLRDQLGRGWFRTSYRMLI
jgi:hypothetical protein